ncbi:hypothetical protein GKQ38_02480 [Candidatus Nanohaloarchaea archaeon]|nr:hypothetical protein GKQ38_02480 [Candidatus Nanohaloarchaea archaeon]
MIQVGKFDCDKCDKSFSSEQALQQHKEDYDHSKLEECSKCGEKFSSKESLREHKKKHWGTVRKTVLGNKLAIAGILIALTVAGGGLALNSMNPGQSTEEKISKNVDKIVRISGGEYYFRPSTTGVNKTGTVMVRFTNRGSIGHNLRLTGVGKGTSLVQPGQSESFTVNVSKAGELPLRFECTLPGHSEQGMVGRFVST